MITYGYRRGNLYANLNWRDNYPTKVTGTPRFYRPLFSEEDGELRLETSPDGASFTSLPSAPKERRLPPVPSGAAGGTWRTLIEWEGAPAAGHHFLRIRWTGPAELNRVEIYHDGR